MTISREQVINRLREAGWSFKRQASRVEIYKKKGSAQRLSVAHRKQLELPYVRIVLQQAGLTKHQIERFIAGATK